MGRRGMPKRRFYYDRKGNLTGSSSDTYLATSKGCGGVILFLALIAILGHGNSREQSAPEYPSFEDSIADGELFPEPQKMWIEQDMSLDQKCRDREASERGADAACSERSKSLRGLNLAGICLGKKGTLEGPKKYHSCVEDSLREQSKDFQ